MAVKFLRRPIHLLRIQAKSTDTLPTLQPHNDGSFAYILDTREVYTWGEGEWHKI